MGPFPAITVLALLNALLLGAITVAPLLRRRRVRTFRHQQISVRLEALTTNHHPLSTNHPPPSGDDLELCATLTRLDRQARYELLSSLDRHDQSPRADLLAMAVDRGATDRIAAIRLLGTTCDSRARQVLTTLLGDPDPTVRRVSAAAAAWSARVGYPTPLDEALVERLLQTLEHEPLPPVVDAVIEALTYSLDPRVPAALLRQIPSSRDAMRERLVESTALFAHLTQSAERRQIQEGVAAR